MSFLGYRLQEQAKVSRPCCFRRTLCITHGFGLEACSRAPEARKLVSFLPLDMDLGLHSASPDTTERHWCKALSNSGACLCHLHWQIVCPLPCSLPGDSCLVASRAMSRITIGIIHVNRRITAHVPPSSTKTHRLGPKAAHHRKALQIILPKQPEIPPKPEQTYKS